MRLTVTKLLSQLALVAVMAQGQTQVDLRTQSKSIDFSAASSTKPFAAGPSLPATCTVGQMFFVTGATGGQNVYGCSAANSWTLQSGGPTSPTTVENSGTVIGTRGILDLSAGQGLLWSISDTGTEISAQAALDTSLAQTRGGDQSGADLFCSSTSTASPGAVYVCPLNPTLTGYTTGMLLHWIPDVGAVGGAAPTLNVDSLGAIAIEKADGVSNPTSFDVIAGQLYALWYDGAVFRLSGGPSGTTAKLIASGTAALGTSPVASGSCTPPVTATAAGVATSDNIAADFNADPTSTPGFSPAAGGILSIIRYPTANAVNFKVCNNTASTLTPGAVTLNWRVVR